ncbi:MAG: histone deacetylase, partial [Gammaproteobacteria bacterium]
SVLASMPIPWRNIFANEVPDRQSGGTGFVFDDIYLQHRLAPGHPESPERLKAIMTMMESSGLLARVNRLAPKDNILPHVYDIHTEEHLRTIKSKYGSSHDVAIAVVGGMLAAVDAVCKGELKNAFCASRPPKHHATNTGRVEGFCFYNSIAIAARYAQKVYGLNRILIVDWDYHHGNGTEAVFYSDPSVLYFSTHDFYAYPGTGDPDKVGEGAGWGYNINVHLGCGVTDTGIISAFEQRLLPAAEKFKPDMILISAGFDSKQDDLLGCFNVTDTAYIKLTQMLMALADKYCAGRLVSMLEGGYNLKGLASAVVAHVNTLIKI